MTHQKKKRVFFDILFREKCVYEIDGLIIMIYRDDFGFLTNKNMKKIKNYQLIFIKILLYYLMKLLLVLKMMLIFIIKML